MKVEVLHQVRTVLMLRMIMLYLWTDSYYRFKTGLQGSTIPLLSLRMLSLVLTPIKAGFFGSM